MFCVSLYINILPKVYVVVGGTNSLGGTMSHTEILQEGGQRWETGQPLPRILAGMASVSLDNSVLLLGIA